MEEKIYYPRQYGATKIDIVREMNEHIQWAVEDFDDAVEREDDEVEVYHIPDGFEITIDNPLLTDEFIQEYLNMYAEVFLDNGEEKIDEANSEAWDVQKHWLLGKFNFPHSKLIIGHGRK